MDGMIVNGLQGDGAIQSYMNDAGAQEMVYQTGGGAAKVVQPPDMAHVAWSRNATIYEVNIRQYTPEGTLNGMGDERMHEAYVCGLKPATTYYYRVGGGAPGTPPRRRELVRSALGAEA